MKRKTIALALTGASGAPYFMRALERLRAQPVDLHVLCSEGGRRVLQEECGLQWRDIDFEGVRVHSQKDIGACIASGSFRLSALVILPCSQNTLSAIAAGIADNLITRTAAVQLKERRTLILVQRETPLSLMALRAMTALCEAGALVMPASPGFYHKPQSIADMVDSVVDRVLDHLDLDDPIIKRWNP